MCGLEKYEVYFLPLNRLEKIVPYIGINKLHIYVH